MRKIKIINVVGARPNFMKIAPIMREMNNADGIDPLLVHTGQHYDKKMSKSFFDDLEIPRPDMDLGVGSGSHAVQTAEIIKRFEPILLDEKPDYVLVVGDVNSTIACALTASKLGIKIIHVEAGLRSFDRSMPEEINRVLTDSISDLLFITEKSAEKNLLSEGISNNKIFFVGNVMIDTLLSHKEKAERSDILFRLGLDSLKADKRQQSISPYAVLTLHRPSNVDFEDNLRAILEAMAVLSSELSVVFPVHPRTRKNISGFGLDGLFVEVDKKRDPLEAEGIRIIEPLGYLEFLKLMSNAKLVVTDSGGMQEETTVLKVPCLTVRENTERPVTVDEGTNTIVGTDKEKIIHEGLNILKGQTKNGCIPKFWDGGAAKKIIRIILDDFLNKN